MRRPRFVGTPIVLFGIAWLALVGFLTVKLWNGLMPPIFGLPAINFWQALGLFLLGRVLFGGFGGFGGRMAKTRFVRGWKDLTPEERQRFNRALGLRKAGNGPQSEAGESA